MSTSAPQRLKEVSSSLTQDHLGEVHVEGHHGDYATLCGIDGQEHTLTPTDEAPTCIACLDTVRRVLAAAPVPTLRRWLAAVGMEVRGEAPVRGGQHVN